MQKRMSIDTIALYATSARFFVVVAPPALHCDKGTMCNAVTYSRRGWCRLEQWARLIAGGVGNMFIFDGTELMQFAGIDKWLKSAVHVYDGEFACDSDRVNLVDTVIGLWSLALLHRDSAEREKVISLVQEHRESVFPVKYFGSLLEILERDVLNLGAEVEASPRVRQDEGLEQPNHTRVCMDDCSFSQESSPQITRPWQAISRISFVESVGSPQIPRRAFLRANTTNVAPRSPTKGRSSEWPMA
uniref:Uncharacterized protein n=4 Tax=Chrysotila carterae TaxID=13221 RepID=A0A7S4EWI0_CHRCT